MATFNVQVGTDPRGVRQTKLADGQVNMGVLVVKGTSAGDVKEATSLTAVPYAVSLVNEDIARENETSGVAGEFYADNEPCDIMTLVPGMILNIPVASPVTEGQLLRPHVDGNVAAGTQDKIIGRALSTQATTGDRVQLMVINLMAEGQKGLTD